MEFCDLGAYCSVKECQQQDFLPFKCNQCQLFFCLEHRTASSHGCKDTGVQALICQNCNKAIRVNQNENQELLLKKHLKKECVALQLQKCQYCEQKLTIVTSTNCSICKQKVCIRDRHLHKCFSPNQFPKQKTQFNGNQDFQILRSKCPRCGYKVAGQEELNLHLIFQH